MSSFRVLSEVDFEGLDLSPDNPELKAFAAQSGSNHTVLVTKPTQLVVSEDLVFLTFNCNPLLEELGLNSEDFSWCRRRNSSCVTGKYIAADPPKCGHFLGHRKCVLIREVS